ncbi:hypothetical protein HER10_EVM0004261 [Colletotrichum scovillei]|uniref:uncharacterized protein n=1 Tax=Colletotrichum scovillei TaxID=1209932 RepID=UPI0015C3C6A1|nr:uncharacterized protein HER10_EVM0004261 [Colletotrichum scovillei]KAF4782917.1 hypothetical protein HER10_EVM0004261 [Colletotrichum scovillei]
MSDHESGRPTLASDEPVIPEPQFFWEADDVPAEDSDLFQSCINRPPRDPKLKHEVFQPKKDQVSNWSSAPNPECDASFGDDGVTATVNAYGDLMQFSSFLGVGHSGVFSADHRIIDEPYWVRDRAEQLLKMRQDRDREELIYGLRVPNITPEKCQAVGYVHDRWPRYEFDDGNLKVTMQWMVHEKTVLQQCIIANNGVDEVDVPIRFARGIHIRDLDYLDRSFRFNENEGKHDQLQTLGPNGYGWVLVHPFKHGTVNKDEKDDPEAFRPNSRSTTVSQIGTKAMDSSAPPSPAPEQPDAVAVVVSIFLDGKAVRWETGNDSRHGDGVTELSVKSLKQNGLFEVVTAYKMTHLTRSKAKWDSFLIPPAWADVSKHLASVSFTAFRLSDHIKPPKDMEEEQSKGFIDRLMRYTSSTRDTQLHGLPKDSSINHIDFVVRRNLEHILSVCVIPFPKSSETKEMAGVVLTCGDVSGHRVCSSASFFAFSFLLEIAKYLHAIEKPSPEDPYKSLKRRIYSVCRSHLKWLLEAGLTEENVFAANYWPTGRIMLADTESESFMPSNSFTDTPFQLMKASAFTSLYRSNDDLDLARRVIRRVAPAWLGTLHKFDKRSSHVWPHAQDEGCNKYRLNEHVWIWRALQTIEDDRRRTTDTKNLPDDGGDNHGEASKAGREYQRDNDVTQGNHIASEEEKLYRQFGSDGIQRDILRRFTAENDVSKKRMLATTRSSRETRFLLHASDTALLYGIEWNFFLQKLVDEVWDNTIEAQVHHNENSETGWDNSTRYALAIMMGARNMSLNKKSPKDLVKSAFDVLFRSTSPNGLFYGQLDGTTKEPALFGRERDRDFYFHATFEIPYILLTHCWRIEYRFKEVSEKDPEISQIRSATKTTDPRLFNDVVERMQQQPKHQEHRSPTTQAATSQIGEAPKRLKVTAMKKSVPFNSLIDQSSIVDLEEEWLYNYPYFLGNTSCAPEGFNEEAKKLLMPAERNRSGTIVAKAAEGYFEALNKYPEGLIAAGIRLPDPFFRSISRKAWVVDIRKQKNLSKRERAHRDEPSDKLYHKQLWNALSQPRTAEIAKKRLVWLPDANTETALICYISSPPDEQPAMSHFFDCHSHFENQFLEETTMVLNTWMSELHLSFYRMVEKNHVQLRGIPELVMKEVPGSTDKRLARAAMGFRISGDFFDRYWTCHLIEYIPGHVVKDSSEGPENKPWGEQGWRQRKVLELHLFDRILKEIVRSTKEIFEAVIDELGDKGGTMSFSTLSSVEYFSSSARWQSCQQLLQDMEKDISEVLSTVAKWETREKDRGQERPRWTRNDERKYRGFIGKMQAATNSSIRELQNCRNNIRSQKAQLISYQQQSRDTLSLIDAENVRLFTYVTVVFLPIGFAASVFSMSETPPRDVLKPMIICSVVALALTIVALVNAKKVLTAINSYSYSKMRNSQLSSTDEIQGKMERRLPTHEQEIAKVGGTGKENQKRGDVDARHEMERSSSFSGHLRFWLAYILIDLPAQQVSRAYGVMEGPESTYWVTYVHVIIGFMVLPVLLVARLFQHLLYNVMDLSQLAWGRCKLYIVSAEPKPYDLNRHWLTNTMRVHRPLEGKLMEVNKRLSDLRVSKGQPSGDETSLPREA